MATPRLLSDRQEREVALAYLCGVDKDFLGKEYDISEATIKTSIIGIRSKQWDDELVEFYRKTDPKKRDRNSAHLFLSSQRNVEKPEPLGLVDFMRDREVYDLVNREIYRPGEEIVLERTSLGDYLEQAGSNPYSNLIEAIFGSYMNPNRIVRNKVIEEVNSAYSSGEDFSLDDIFAAIGDEIIQKIVNGALMWTDTKKDFVHYVLGSLSEREQEALGKHFGLDGYNQKLNLKEVGEILGVKATRARQIKVRSFRKLRSKGGGKYLKTLAGLATDADVEYARKMEEFDVPIVELGFEKRLLDKLHNRGAYRIMDLADISEPGLLTPVKFSNITQKGISEIKAVLAQYNLELRQ